MCDRFEIGKSKRKLYHGSLDQGCAATNWWSLASGRRSRITRSVRENRLLKSISQHRTPVVPTILRRLSYSERPTTIRVRGHEEVVKSTQIIIWASIADFDQRELDPATPRFPVAMDTGLSHSFAIQEEHLKRWAGLDQRSLWKLRDISIKGDVVPLHEAEVWLHSNQPGDVTRLDTELLSLCKSNRDCGLSQRDAQSSPAAVARSAGPRMVEAPSHHRQRASPRLALTPRRFWFF